ncbi:RING finger protein, putative [Talaromyces marneffei ATCC 18224]|uniref:RBR-type E3 ubiquitin transferase n=1 Tax=Talaromyces marneffei (strain ATCC 18224 / CBS 334.59 / QM 7333) TaxID=441960 RepID=B6QUC4_TALMQ|nr:RING finger protein, putative [Talaromyces marneffei ATCC 18224]
MWRGLPSDLPAGIDNLDYTDDVYGTDNDRFKDGRDNSTSTYPVLKTPYYGSRYSVPRKPLPHDSANTRVENQLKLVKEANFWSSLEEEFRNSFEEQLRNAEVELERALESLRTANTQSRFNYEERHLPQQEIPQPSIHPTDRLTSCNICVEDFSNTVTRPAWISIACAHEPSVCNICISKSIKSDLETRIWDQIRCPECQTLLIYDDIKRLADPETFERYERLSFRSAVGSDENFIWCQQCDFGQLHEKGASEPIVRCLNCGFRSCYLHAGPWHSGLTCDEYDEMLQNPDEYQSVRGRDNSDLEMTRRLQGEQDLEAAQEISNRDQRKEEERQKRRHREEREKAGAAQLMEAERRRKERQRTEEEERARETKRQQEKIRKEDQERLLMDARRQRENALSMETMKQTTKQCPGCERPIEKNRGCDHMTYSVVRKFKTSTKLSISFKKSTIVKKSII